MANLPNGHPLIKPYLHLRDYGQQEYADKVANFCDMARRTEEQLQLLQKYVEQLEQRDPSNSYAAQRQRTMEQRFHIDSRKGHE